MKARIECVLCQQQQALRVVRLATDDHALHETVLRQVLSHLATIPWTDDPMTMSQGVYALINKATGNPDPYNALKSRSNREILALYPELQHQIRTSDDPLLTACKFAVAGNIMDFGAHAAFNVQETIDHVLQTDFAINAYPRLKTDLESASSVLLFADNAGELVFDKLLLETMLAQTPLKRLTVVVKEFPIIND
ncbi:DUF89 family protein, partial [candidate division KSB3 bacterium]|nr:DUF89 family protein [candidate division KSB3 bacterium]